MAPPTPVFLSQVALMYNCPRTATVAATQHSVVWVLERDVFRRHVQELQESEASQLELFLNSGGWHVLFGDWVAHLKFVRNGVGWMPLRSSPPLSQPWCSAHPEPTEQGREADPGGCI